MELEPFLYTIITILKRFFGVDLDKAISLVKKQHKMRF